MKSEKLTYLLHRLAMLMDSFEDHQLTQHFGITFSQFRVLAGISQGKVCQSEIASYWKITDAAINRQVDLLIEAGLLIKKPQPENTRKNLLELTASGVKKLEEVFTFLDEKYTKIYSSLSDKEFEKLVTQLEEILNALGEDSSGTSR